VSETRLRICPFCEATCGLALEVRGREVLAVSGDEADVFSRGHLCPKGVAIRELDADPDRLRRPLLRRGRDFVEASWALITPIHEAWQAQRARDIAAYEGGEWGPATSYAMMKADGRRWRTL